MPIVFGIETSCDETSVCLLENHNILSLQTFSQIDLHSKYGGVVPEISARSHLEKISDLTKFCFQDAKINPEQIDAIAVTTSPGLIGSLIVGVGFAKGLGLFLNKQILSINHLKAHVFTTKISHGIEQNFYSLLISGGHCKIYKVSNLCDMRELGSTIDDSVGECFDKLAKMLGLDYPGGPKIEALAQNGDENLIKFLIPMKKYNDTDFSFSGLKTFLLHKIASKSYRPEDICASFQKIVLNILTDRMFNAIKADNFEFKKIVVCGGVASNQYLRHGMSSFFSNYNLDVIYAPANLCTDNAAMVANVGIIALNNNLENEFSLKNL